MTGLLENLRACALGMGEVKTDSGDYGVFDDAADEIERLRATIQAAQHELRNRSGVYALQILDGEIPPEDSD